MSSTVSRTTVPGVGIIILAAGGSSRMGRPKQLLMLNGKTLLRRAAETALAGVCRPVVVVLGANAALVEMELTGLNVTIVNNTQWESGMGSSIRAGLEAIQPAATRAVILMLCDQPRVSTALLNQLVDVSQSKNAGMVATEYGGSVGVPALFGAEHYAELMSLNAAGGAKTLLIRHATTVARVAFPEAAIDMDTIEDYERLKQ